MNEFIVKRIFKGQLATGLAAWILCLVLACVLWPLWSMFFKSIFSALAAPGLAAAGSKLAGQLIGEWWKAPGGNHFIVILRRIRFVTDTVDQHLRNLI